MNVTKIIFVAVCMTLCLCGCAQSKVSNSLIDSIKMENGLRQKEILVKVVELEKNFISDAIWSGYGFRQSSTCMTFSFMDVEYTLDVDSTCLSQKWDLIRSGVNEQMFVTIVILEKETTSSKSEPYAIIVDVKPCFE